MFLLLPALEDRRTKRLQKRAGRKRRYIATDGRPREVQPFHKGLMCLLYLRHNTSHEVVGRMFGFSADTAENAFAEVLPLLRDLFPNEKGSVAAITFAVIIRPTDYPSFIREHSRETK